MSTFLEELKELADAVHAASTKEIAVPPLNRLVVRFRPPPAAERETLTPIVAKYRTGGALSSDEERQLIVQCCDEILRRNGTGDLEQVDPDGGPLRFDGGDERWGDDVENARDCVRKLYNLDEQPLVASAVADQLVDWLTGLDAQVKARVEGESGSGAAS